MERLTWLVILTLTASYLVRDMALFFERFRSKNTQTHISLRSLEQVPFPAIVINNGGGIDPMGHIRNSGNILSEDGIQTEGSSNLK